MLPGLPPFPAVPGPNPADIANGVPIAFQSAPLGTCRQLHSRRSEKLPTNGWPNAYLPEQEKNFSVNLNHGYYGFFVQDQWKATPKLTFNYGLRYDFESGLSDQMDVSHKGFQPRVGLAYSPDRKTVIRAGFGLFNDRYALSFLFITYPQRPAVLANADLPPNRKGAESAGYQLNQYPFIPVPGVPTPAQIAANFFKTGQVFSHSVVGTAAAPTPVGYSYTDRHSPHSLFGAGQPRDQSGDRPRVHRRCGLSVCRRASPAALDGGQYLSGPGNFERAVSLRAGRTAAAGLSCRQELLQRSSALPCWSDLLQRSHRKFRVSRRHAASEQDGRQAISASMPVTRFPTRWMTARLRHSSAFRKTFFAEVWNAPPRTRMPAIASSRTSRSWARRIRSCEKFPAEQHRHSSESAAVYAVRRLRLRTMTSSRPPIALGIFRAIRTRATAFRLGTSACRARSAFAREKTRLELGRRCLQSAQSRKCGRSRRRLRNLQSLRRTAAPAVQGRRQPGDPGRSGRRLPRGRACRYRILVSVLRERCSIRGSCNCR